MRKAQQVEENLQALGWRVNDDEIRRIEGVSVQGKTARLWQRGVAVDGVFA